MKVNITFEKQLKPKIGDICTIVWGTRFDTKFNYIIHRGEYEGDTRVFLIGLDGVQRAFYSAACRTLEDLMKEIVNDPTVQRVVVTSQDHYEIDVVKKGGIK